MRFGIFELDEVNLELRRAGVLIKLTPRQFRLLQLLARNPGRVISRDEIQKEIWGDETFVDFQRNVNVCVAQLRAILDDSSASPRFIETIPRRGYRLLVPVTSSEKPDAEPPPVLQNSGVRSSRNAMVTIGAMLAVLCCTVGAIFALHDGRSAGQIRLAVLPFDTTEANSPPDSEIAVLADALTTELISTLGSQNGRLGVIGRASVMRFKGSAPDLSKITKALQADYVIDGTLRHQRDRLRLTAALVRTSDQIEVWTETFELDAKDSFELQEDVAAHVAAGALHQLFPDAPVSPRKKVALRESAYQEYINGRYLQHQGTIDALQRSIPILRNATAQAPEFSPAWAALAETYMAIARTGNPDRSLYPNARAAAQVALQADAGDFEAHNALANVLFWHEWNWSQADKDFQTAIAGNPSYALAHHDRAFFLVAVGRREEGLTELRKALALDPLSVRVNIDAGWLLLQARRFDRAIAQARRAKELQPGLKAADECIARAILYQTGGGMASPDSEMAGDNFSHAIFVALRGNDDEAIRALDDAYAVRNPMMVFLNTEPSFDRLRSHARFQTLLERVRLPL